MPLAAFIYFLCYLDRSNIGNAKVLNTSTKNDMQSETGMSNYEFNLALMIFLIGCELGNFALFFFLLPSTPALSSMFQITNSIYLQRLPIRGSVEHLAQEIATISMACFPHGKCATHCSLVALPL